MELCEDRDSSQAKLGNFNSKDCLVTVAKPYKLLMLSIRKCCMLHFERYIVYCVVVALLPTLVAVISETTM